MGAGRIFQKAAATFPLRKAYRMSLLLAWSISLDSTFNASLGIVFCDPPVREATQDGGEEEPNQWG